MFVFLFDTRLWLCCYLLFGVNLFVFVDISYACNCNVNIYVVLSFRKSGAYVPNAGISSL